MKRPAARTLYAAAVAGAVAAMSSLSTAAVAAVDSNRYIVKFKSGAFAQGRATLARQRVPVLVDLAEVDAVAVSLSAAAIADLRRSSLVEFIERDLPQYPLASGGGTEVVPYGIPMVQADQVSDLSAGSQKVCIIDSGIDGTHPDLAQLTLSGENLTSSGSWNTDEDGHGTHVAGTIAALGGNGIGVVGVLPSGAMPLHIVKVFDESGSSASSTIAKGMLRCGESGARIVSMSLGGSLPSLLQGLVVRRLYNSGVLLIAAAGNAGTTAVSYPAGFQEVVSVAAVDANKQKADFSQYNSDVELAAPGVGTLSTVPVGTALVATTTVAGQAYESLAMDGSPVISATAPLYDFGTGEVDDAGVAGKVCLIARGNISFSDKVVRCQSNGGVGAIIYNNVAGTFSGTLGDVVTTIPSVSVSDTSGAAMLGQLGQTASVGISTGDYAYFNGTSMATPHVSAVAALVWSQFPSCTAAQLRASLNASAEDLGAAGRDVNFGYGLVQAKAAVDRIASLGCGN